VGKGGYSTITCSTNSVFPFDLRATHFNPVRGHNGSMSDSHMTVDSTITSEDTMSPFESPTSFGPADLRSQQKELDRLNRQAQRREEELRTNARNQAGRFLEWSKEWGPETCQSIGSELRDILNGTLMDYDDQLRKEVEERIGYMQTAFDIAVGHIPADSSSSISASEGSGEMDE
jgi:hypothetical protein